MKNLSKTMGFPFALFVFWKLLLVVTVFLTVTFIPLVNHNFFGGGLENYLEAPYIFGWANFDGEHFLSISQTGYKSLEQAFFPLYPTVISLLSNIFGKTILNLVMVGLIVSNISFLISLVLLYKLIRLEYTDQIARWTLLSLALFPTSFYFGAMYSESLFLVLSLASFYFARRNKWVWASLFGVLASTTRVFGVLLLPALVIEAWQGKRSIRDVFWLVFIPLGLLGYMFLQWVTVGDPLAFYNLQKIIGEQHQSGLVILPQVFFRYFKMITTFSTENPAFQTVVLELLVGFVFFILPILGYFKKVRYSYLFYAMVGFLLPTIQGSFSSSPRYVLILFPSFLVLAIILSSLEGWQKALYVAFSTVWLGCEAALFLGGYWVA